ncbi:hypothetical protein SERLA73DRAFT_79648 [Serpula lacrymans var. lacrymans S7.3]|uniref:Uncharacterized protein n=2 Tax=Serpula lacrymans var. lacrymans TaxID=341189 RepID=F8QH35_SERL3|nr:uncharacterized protein SERLADRAFT_437840 [Serpula lacrymans var. lacrymans S7.9]EGN92363.1 hypothetical protein SERLA73DRAFT_79648 [Serpula lacrymans var. lacrymans S7.3]EGO24224.1 hypothetical protein SERLADRAFT_437840 [Serpula lacrymans var. lacrymans S7.9]
MELAQRQECEYGMSRWIKLPMEELGQMAAFVSVSATSWLIKLIDTNNYGDSSQETFPIDIYHPAYVAIERPSLVRPAVALQWHGDGIARDQRVPVVLNPLAIHPPHVVLRTARGSVVWTRFSRSQAVRIAQNPNTIDDGSHDNLIFA